MNCPIHNTSMTLLFTSARCDACDGLLAPSAPRDDALRGDLYMAWDQAVNRAMQAMGAGK